MNATDIWQISDTFTQILVLFFKFFSDCFLPENSVFNLLGFFFFVFWSTFGHIPWYINWVSGVMWPKELSCTIYLSVLYFTDSFISHSPNGRRSINPYILVKRSSFPVVWLLLLQYPLFTHQITRTDDCLAK